MAKNYEKQGKHIGYIFGGIFALILGGFLIALYFPAWLTAIAGIEPIWDLSNTFTELFGANLMDLINTWSTLGVLIAFCFLYFIDLFARPSASSVMFRFSSCFICLAFSVPQLFIALASMINGIDLTAYTNYVFIGLYALAFIFYFIGIIVRAKQKYHRNRATSTLVFANTFWVGLGALPVAQMIASLMGKNVAFLDSAATIIDANLIGFIAIFLILIAIWMFCTIPHRVVVDYNPDTRGKSKKSKPKIINSGKKGGKEEKELERETLEDENTQEQPMPEARGFAHNAPTTANMGGMQNTVPQNPYAVQQPQNPYAAQQPQNPYVQNSISQNPYAAQPAPQAPIPPKPIINNGVNILNNGAPQNPYANYNNFIQNNPNNRPQNPMPPRPTAPAPAPRPMPRPAPAPAQRPMPPRPAPIPPRPVQPARPMPHPMPPRPMQNPFAAQNPAQRPMPQRKLPPRPVNKGNPNNPNGVNNGNVGNNGNNNGM